MSKAAKTPLDPAYWEVELDLTEKGQFDGSGIDFFVFARIKYNTQIQSRDLALQKLRDALNAKIDAEFLKPAKRSMTLTDDSVQRIRESLDKNKGG